MKNWEILPAMGGDTVYVSLAGRWDNDVGIW